MRNKITACSLFTRLSKISSEVLVDLFLTSQSLIFNFLPDSRSNVWRTKTDIIKSQKCWLYQFWSSIQKFLFMKSKITFYYFGFFFLTQISLFAFHFYFASENLVMIGSNLIRIHIFLSSSTVTCILMSVYHSNYESIRFIEWID